MRTLRRSRSFAVVAAVLALAMPVSTSLPAAASLANPPAARQDEKKESAAGQQPIVGLDAFNLMLTNLAELLPELIRDRPKGEDSEREAAFRAINAMWVAAIGSTISLPVAGAGIGLVCDICLLGGDLGAGTLAGGLIGAGAAGANFAAWCVVIFALSLYINEKYPEKAETASRGIGEAQSTRGIAGFAGPYESQMIHILSIVTPESVKQVAQTWQNTPGLKAHEKAALGSTRWLQPTIQKLAYLKENNRLTPNSSRALPRSAWLETVNTLLSPSTSAEDRWLTALGLGATSASMSGGDFVLNVPTALTLVGAPATVKAEMPGFALKVGGTGGALDPYIKTSVRPANFKVSLGKASVVRSGADRDKLRVTCSIARNSSIGRASIRLKWNGPEASLADFQPRITSPINGSLFFRVEGEGIVLDKISMGGYAFGFQMPQGFPKMPGLDQMVADLSKGIMNELGKMMNGVPWANVFTPFKALPAKSLQKDLEKSAHAYGLYDIKRVGKVGLSGGKLNAQVVATKVKLRDSGITAQKVATVFGQSPLAAKGSGLELKRPVGVNLINSGSKSP